MILYLVADKLGTHATFFFFFFRKPTFQISGTKFSECRLKKIYIQHIHRKESLLQAWLNHYYEINLKEFYL